MPRQSGQAIAAHRGRALAVGITLHAVLLISLTVGMVFDLVDGSRLGPMLIGAYVAASLVITVAMFWPALRRGGARTGR